MKDFVNKMKEYGFEIAVDFSSLTIVGCRHIVFAKEDNNYIYNININVDSKEITFWKMYKEVRHPDYGRAIAYSVDCNLVKLVADNFEKLERKIKGLNHKNMVVKDNEED